MDDGSILSHVMADKMMYIPNDEAQQKTFSRLQLLVETFGH